MTKSASKPTKTTNFLLAAAGAWFVPGAGHLYLGRPVRAAILFVVIQAMFWSGIAVGGALTVNRAQEPWWFIAQLCTGGSGLVSYARSSLELGRAQRAVAGQIPPPPARPADPRYTLHWQYEMQRWRQHKTEILDAELAKDHLALVPPTSGIALVLSGVAGMLNLMCIFDAMMLSLMGRYGEPGREESA